MSFDCALIFYRGAPLTLEQLADAIDRSATRAERGQDAIAARHAPSVLVHHDWLGRESRVHAIALYARDAGSTSLARPLALLDELRQRVRAREPALAEKLKAPLDQIRDALEEVDEKPTTPTRALPADFLSRVARELSVPAGATLQVSLASEVAVRRVAEFERGAAKVELPGASAEQADEQLARFSKVEDASAHSVYWEQLSPKDRRPPLFLVVERGERMRPAPMLDVHEEKGFVPVL